MPMQAESTFRDTLDSISYPHTLRLVPNFVQSSELLALLIGKNIEKKSDGRGNQKFTIGKTYTGFQKRLAINKSELYKTKAALNDLAIEWGDEKEGKVDRDLIYGDVEPANLAHDVEMTERDKQIIEGRPDEWADWISDSFDQLAQYISIFLINQIFASVPNTNGTKGVITRTDESTRNGLVGLNRIVATTGKYAGKDTDDFRYWKGHAFDMGSALLGYPATEMDSIADLIATDTSRVITRFQDIVTRGLAQCTQWGRPGDKYVIVLNPYVYDYIFTPAVQTVKLLSVSLKTGSALFGAGMKDKGMDLSIIPDDGYMINGALVIKESSMIADKYVMPVNKMYFLNLNDLVFEAHKKNNFTLTGWQDIKTKHKVAINSCEATYRFYAKQRITHGVMTLDSAVVDELKAITGVDFTTE